MDCMTRTYQVQLTFCTNAVSAGAFAILSAQSVKDVGFLLLWQRAVLATGHFIQHHHSLRDRGNLKD